MRAAIRPLPMIGRATSGWWRRQATLDGHAISQPVGIVNCRAQIHTRSNGCLLGLSGNAPVIRVSREHARQGDGRLDRSDLVEELPVEPAPGTPVGPRASR